MKIRPPSNAAAIWKAKDKAFEHRRPWEALLNEVYDKILVYRDPAERSGGVGAARMNHLFDSTAVSSAFRFAGRLKNDIAPSLQPFFKIELGPAAKARLSKADFDRLSKGLQDVSAAAYAAIDTPGFHAATSEGCVDLTAGQAAILISEGDADEPVIFEAVPAIDVALMEGRAGKVTEIHYARKFSARVIAARWPDAVRDNKLPKAVMDALGKDGNSETEFEVAQSTFWNGEDRRWELHVVMAGAGSKGDGYVEIHTQNTRTCPWLTPRFFKVPGEAQGRGPAMMALPDVRVLNKTVELTLRAAALAIMGLWTRTQGLNAASTLNLQRLAPGSMIPVTSNQSANPEIRALDVPRNFDVSNIMISEFRERIREILFDRAIPQSRGDTPRSASEVIEHIRIYAEDLAVVYGRLVQEFVVPLVQRVLELLYKQNLLPDLIQIDQLTANVKIVSPLADAQNMNDLTRVTRWLELMAGTVGEDALMMSAKVEDVGEYFARKLGVPEELIREAKERGDVQKLIAAMAARREQQEAAA
tara:strand:- start:1487 stop:3079 length:1593 start_codon:yes stop_codon:yes gene_type:complete